MIIIAFCLKMSKMGNPPVDPSYPDPPPPTPALNSTMKNMDKDFAMINNNNINIKTNRNQKKAFMNIKRSQSRSEDESW